MIDWHAPPKLYYKGFNNYLFGLVLCANIQSFPVMFVNNNNTLLIKYYKKVLTTASLCDTIDTVKIINITSKELLIL